MKQKFPIILLILLSIAFVVSAIDIQDTWLTWLLESMPVIITVPILIYSYKKFTFSNFAYLLIFIHSLLLLYGAHYSYAKVPLGYWMEDVFGFTRNNYDKIGHFMQGFGPVIYARELFLRCTPLKRGRWASFASFCVAMTVSALYEIIEWAASMTNPEDTEAFLGMQGYIWDTQTDMFMCMIGSLLALTLFSTLHDKSMGRVEA